MCKSIRRSPSSPTLQTYPYHGQACPSPNGRNGTSPANGQACYWFSNGASIGCATPDGSTRGPIPDTPCDPSDPSKMCRRKMDTCGAGAMATVCDPALRTINTGAECGADDDWYYYSPWRAPGSAGVYDSCGMAGGTPRSGMFGGNYVSTAHAKQGDLGSKTLQPHASGGARMVWSAGSVVEVSWNILANHVSRGVGYMRSLTFPTNRALASTARREEATNTACARRTRR